MDDAPTSSTEREDALPMELTVDEKAYEAWFRRKVQEALDDPHPPIPDELARAHFAKRRAAALAK